MRWRDAWYNYLVNELARRRKAAGLTQEQLAKAIGCSQAAVSLWERGEANPRPWTRRAIEHALTENGGHPER
jgi:transcriptional regulator with XRE-family HTH domain